MNGQYHPIPPYGPVRVILEQLAEYLAVSNISNITLRRQAQQSALATVSNLVAAQMDQLTALRTPAPLKEGTSPKGQTGP